MNRQYLDPVLLGSYPDELREIFGEAWPEWPAEDMKGIRQPIDFLGINYYTRSVTKHDDSAWPLRASRVLQKQATYTETGWEVFPQGLTDTLVWIKQRYGDIPQYVTENGAAFFDPPVAEGGRIDDPLRVDYLRQHIGALADALRAGVDLRGYFAWSLLDNLEWAHGYSKRFGLVHVDFERQTRTPKASARYYADVIAAHKRGVAGGAPVEAGR
jgi:beta-glucosidase